MEERPRLRNDPGQPGLTPCPRSAPRSLSRKLLGMAAAAPRNLDYCARSLRVVFRRCSARGAAGSADSGSLPSNIESLGDNGARLGRAEPAISPAPGRPET